MSMKLLREKHLVAITCDGILKKTKKIQSCDNDKVDSIHDDVPMNEDVDWDEDVELSE